jgi:hypothetical protein
MTLGERVIWPEQSRDVCAERRTSCVAGAREGGRRGS